MSTLVPEVLGCLLLEVIEALSGNTNAGLLGVEGEREAVGEVEGGQRVYWGLVVCCCSVYVCVCVCVWSVCGVREQKL